MKTYLVATSAFALLATMSIALAQAPKGEGGQKEMSQPPMKEGAEKDTPPKAGERKDAPADKKAQQDKASKDAAKDPAKGGKKDAGKETAKDGKKDASDRASKDAPNEKKETVDKDKGDASKKTAEDKGGKASGANLTQQQRTRVKSSFAKHRGKSAKVNITVNVGVAVPRSVRLYAMPQEIVVIVPAYRRYRYFVVGDRVCIVDPDTYEIVEIIIIT
jgi:hypothetical protein